MPRRQRTCSVKKRGRGPYISSRMVSELKYRSMRRRLMRQRRMSSGRSCGLLMASFRADRIHRSVRRATSSCSATKSVKSSSQVTCPRPFMFRPLVNAWREPSARCGIESQCRERCREGAKEVIRATPSDTENLPRLAGRMPPDCHIPHRVGSCHHCRINGRFLATVHGTIW